MGRAIAVQLGSKWYFKTKKALNEHISALKARWPISARITGEDGEFLLAFIQRHPDVVEKVGCGVDFFSKEIHEDEFGYINHGFILHRTDGSETDFRKQTCVDGYHPLKDKVNSVLRRAIHDQIEEFKQFTLEHTHEVYCKFTGELINHKMDIDHVPMDTFKVLIERWMQETNRTYEDIVIAVDTAGTGISYMGDYEQYMSWVLFHFNHAALRPLSRAGNRIFSKREVRLGYLLPESPAAIESWNEYTKYHYGYTMDENGVVTWQ